jgi:hypothetical protein
MNWQAVLFGIFGVLLIVYMLKRRSRLNKSGD